jgi:hypothetical protein
MLTLYPVIYFGLSEAYLSNCWLQQLELTWIDFEWLARNQVELNMVLSRLVKSWLNFWSRSNTSSPDTCINYTARQIAELMFEHVYKLHGVLKSIVSDCGSLFTGTFWKKLHELIEVKVNMLSIYHPKSDGSTERANHTITQMLPQCSSTTQKDWVNQLPTVEFAMNLARSEMTGYSPFFLDTGWMPRSLLWDSDNSQEFPGIANFALQHC